MSNYPETYKTSTGQLIHLPRLMARQEEQIAKHLGILLTKVPQLAEVLNDVMRSGGTLRLDFGMIVNAASTALQHGPEECRHIICVITGKDSEWVLDNLTIREDYPALCLPLWDDFSSLISSAPDDAEDNVSESDEG